MNKNVLLATEKINQLNELIVNYDVDCYIIIARQESDKNFELIFDTYTENLAMAVFSPSLKHILLVHESEACKFEGINGIEIATYSDDFQTALASVLDKFEIKKIMFNACEDDCSKDGLTLGQFIHFFRYFKKPVEEINDMIVKNYDLIGDLRALKSPIELERIRKSVSLAEECIEACYKKFRQGMTEIEISDMFVVEMKKRNLVSSGGDGNPDVPPMIINLRGGMSHRGPMPIKTMPGDVVVLDFFCWHDGFSSDVSRTFYALRKGETQAPPEQQKMFDFVNKNIDMCLELIKPGVKGYEVNKIKVDRVVEMGGKDMGIAAGHQLGRQCHDGGTIFGNKERGPLSQGALRENEVYALEPSFMIPPQNIGAHIEDDLVVTKDGCELLSNRQKELFLIPYEGEIEE